MKELLDHLNKDLPLLANGPYEKTMQKVASQTWLAVSKMNTEPLKNPDDMRRRVEILIEEKIPESTRIRQPFYTDFGKNIKIGAGVFINAGVHMQDQGGIRIGNNVLIGHQVVFASLDHDLAAEKRANLYPGRIVVEDDVWIGANATITKGVTIGRGSVVAAGAVVNQNVPENTIVAGIPAKVIKKL